MGGNERRQHPRLSIAVDVDFRSDHNFYSAKTRDISVGGLFIDTDCALPIGTRLAIDLRFLNQHLRVDAEVMWTLLGDQNETVGVGVRFVDLPDAARQSIEAFMTLRQPMSFGMVEDDEHESA